MSDATAASTTSRIGVEQDFHRHAALGLAVPPPASAPPRCSAASRVRPWASILASRGCRGRRCGPRPAPPARPPRRRRESVRAGRATPTPRAACPRPGSPGGARRRPHRSGTRPGPRRLRRPGRRSRPGPGRRRSVPRRGCRRRSSRKKAFAWPTVMGDSVAGSGEGEAATRSCYPGPGARSNGGSQKREPDQCPVAPPVR